MTHVVPSDQTEALLTKARACRLDGRLTDAKDHYFALIKQEPAHWDAWFELGQLYRIVGDAPSMQKAFQQAVMLAPARWEGHLALTQVLETTGQWEAAAKAYHQLVVAAGTAKPVSNDEQSAWPQQGLLCYVHWQIAQSRLERGDVSRALEALRQALMAYRLSCQGVEVHVDVQAEMQIDLGDILMRLGLTEEAHRAFERASMATGEAALVRLAQRSFHYNLWHEAQEILKRNVMLHPESEQAHWNLAHAYAESWQLEDALQSLAKAEALAPQSGAKSMRASIAGRVGDVDTALKLYQELVTEQGLQSGMGSSAAMSSLYSDQLSAQEVADLHQQLFASLGEDARLPESFKNSRTTNRRIKLGLLSADFHHQHPVNIFMQPVLARLDPEKFETTIYFTGMAHDEQTALARARVAHWRDASKMNDVQLRRLIEADEIDVLIDLAGHTNANRLMMLARRVAPVQVSFLGYPGSTGVPNIDWILTDPIVAPTGCESLFTEQVMRLPNTVFCYAPEVDYPYPAYNNAHAERPLTFGSFNNVPKLTLHTIKLWSAVLKAVPDSRLILKAPSFKDEVAIRLFRDRFVAEGIDPERLEFRGPVGLSDMMAEYADVDIALDPVPYNGGTTTLQAMWMGVPVVVKAGANFVSRMGSSFMQAAGLGDWVAQNDAEYVQIAVRMANDRKALLKLKQGMRDQLLSMPGWDIRRYTHDFENALQAMWATHCKIKVGDE